MDLRKITTRKIYEEIADQLREVILSGALKPGDKLPSTKELAERFQVGRSTVREALSALKATGLVDIRQGEGCYVRQAGAEEVEIPKLDRLLLSPQTVVELSEARKVLEVSNAGLAAERRTPERLARLEQIVSRMAATRDDEAEAKRLDAEFHMALADATGNPILARLLESIGTQVQMAIHDTWNLRMFKNRELAERLLADHQALLRAVREGDAAGARREMDRHLSHVEQVLLEHLGMAGQETPDAHG